MHLYELECERKKKNGDSPSFDEPCCFFPGGTLGVVSFLATDKNYG